MGLFGSKKKLDDGLKKTRNGFFGNILNMMGASEIDDDLYEELEEQLILADTGADMASKLVDELSGEVKHKHLKTGPQALEALEGLIEKELTPDSEFDLSGKPAVILVIGVNGVGKTTSIGKLANAVQEPGQAGDAGCGAIPSVPPPPSSSPSGPTGRAYRLCKHGEGADPAAVVFDAVQSAAKARGGGPGHLRHGGPPAQQKEPDGRADQDPPRRRPRPAPRPAWRRCWCWMPSPGRTPSARRGSSWQAAEAHRRDPHQAGRHRQGRLCDQREGQAGPAGSVCGRGRGH